MLCSVLNILVWMYSTHWPTGRVRRWPPPTTGSPGWQRAAPSGPAGRSADQPSALPWPSGYTLASCQTALGGAERGGYFSRMISLAKMSGLQYVYGHIDTLLLMDPCELCKFFAQTIDRDTPSTWQVTVMTCWFQIAVCHTVISDERLLS